MSTTATSSGARPGYQPLTLPRPAGENGSGNRLSDTSAWAVAHQDKELRELLRRRLRVAVLVIFGFWGLLPIASLPLAFSSDVAPGARVVLASQFTAALMVAALGLLLSRQPTRSVRTLRAFELWIFGLAALQLAISNAYVIQQFGLMTPPIGRPVHPVFSLEGTRLDVITIRWVVLIAGYGSVIPNTFRRCAANVGVLGGLFLALTLGQALWNAVPLAQLPSVMLYPVVWTIVASVIAVFGSYRISMLEKRVADAQRLGQYRLQKYLGSGGMGEVYLAEHVELKQPFAVKLLRPERVADSIVFERFEREVHAMARLEHWNTVEIYDYGRSADGSFYYVMEYLPGLDLHQLVRKGHPLPVARVIHILRQVCAALQEAHANGLLHRDIKPGNVIVCERAGIHDVAKLLDFGLVKQVSTFDDDTAITQEGTVAGTPDFMSPEQASGIANADARSDIYSLGAVAYSMLTGRVVFKKDTAMQTLAAHMYEPVVPPSHHRPDLDPRVEAVVLRCLEKKPEARYPDVASLDRALGACPGAGEWTQKEAAAWWAGREGNEQVTRGA